MQAYQDNISAKVNGVLTPILGVQVTITDTSTGKPAAIYSDNGVTRIDQPLTTDETGYFGFRAANGHYSLSFSSPQIKLDPRAVQLYDPADEAPLTQSQAASPSGASKIGVGAETVENALDALQLPDYNALRAYAGPRKSVYVTSSGITGMFVRDDSDTTSADNGGTIIVATNGVRWKCRVGGPISLAHDPNLSSREIRIVGGAVRRDSGAWAPITTEGHQPLGITGIEEIDAYTMRVHFNQGNAEVGTLLATIDYELAPYAIIGGCSCSANYADFRFYAPVIVDLQNKDTVSVAPWLSAYITKDVPGSTTTATKIIHPPRALNVDPPGATLLNRTPAGSVRSFALDWSPTSCTISTLAELGGLIQRTGSGTFSVSQQTAGSAGQVTATWASGALTVTHPDCGTNSIPEAWSFNTAYKPDVFTWTPTSFKVQFWNPAGSVVGPSDDASMQFLFKRPNAMLPAAMPTAFSARIDLGYLAVPLAAVQNISLNNFWLFGAMVK